MLVIIKASALPREQRLLGKRKGLQLRRGYRQPSMGDGEGFFLVEYIGITLCRGYIKVE